MSPPPESETPFSEPKRPKALTVVSVIGIVLGTLGMLCVCMGLAGVLINGNQQQQQLRGSMTEIMIQIATSVAGVFISMFLLIACVGVLGLRPWSGMMMVVVNIINIIFETVKVILGVIWGIPKAVEQMRHLPPEASAQQIEAMQKIQPYLGYIKIGLYMIAIGVFVLQVIYSTAVLMVMKRPDVKAALASPEIPEPPSMM